MSFVSMKFGTRPFRTETNNLQNVIISRKPTKMIIKTVVGVDHLSVIIITIKIEKFVFLQS